MMPSFGPRSQWASGVKSNFFGSPTVFSSTSSSSDWPGGVRGSGRLGMALVSSSSFASTSRTWLSSAAILSPSPFCSAILASRAAASFILPISLLTALRSALSASTSFSNSRRRASTANASSTVAASSGLCRLTTACLTTSGCVRMMLMSNILASFRCWLILFCVFALVENDPDDRHDDRRENGAGAQAQDEQKQETHQSLTSSKKMTAPHPVLQDEGPPVVPPAF